jgi:hypothetical protein
VTANIWELFPYPTLSGSEFVNGSLLAVHTECKACPTRACAADERVPVGDPQTCRYGLTYARIDGERLLVGMVSTNTTSPSPAARRRLKNEPDRRVKPGVLRAAVQRARALGPGVVDSFESARQVLIENLKHDPEMQKSIADQFRGDYENSLNQSHDFLQLMNLVRGYAESLLHARYPDLAPEDAAER